MQATSGNTVVLRAGRSSSRPAKSFEEFFLSDVQYEIAILINSKLGLIYKNHINVFGRIDCMLTLKKFTQVLAWPGFGNQLKQRPIFFFSSSLRL